MMPIRASNSATPRTTPEEKKGVEGFLTVKDLPAAAPGERLVRESAGQSDTLYAWESGKSTEFGGGASTHSRAAFQASADQTPKIFFFTLRVDHHRRSDEQSQLGEMWL